MEAKITTEEFVQKVMEGLNPAVKKLSDEARKNKQPIPSTHTHVVGATPNHG